MYALAIVYLLGVLGVYHSLSWAREFNRTSFGELFFDLAVALLWIVILPALLIATTIVAVWYWINYYSERKDNE